MALLMILAALSLITGWKEVFVGLIVMHAMLLMRMSSAASHTLAEDRKSGALELLLATSLSIRDVLHGRWMALGRQFFGPILIVGIWHLFSILWIEVMGGFGEAVVPMLAVVPSLILAWIATASFGMWMGLRARHPTAAIWGTLGAVLLGPWLVLASIYSLLAAFEMVPDFHFQSRSAFLTIGIIIWAFYLYGLILVSNNRVRKRFREAATDRYSHTQPIDWRPFRRLMWKVAATASILIVSIWGLRAWINYKGEQQLLETLAAHPEFQMTEPFNHVPPEQNLASWGFIRSAVGDFNLIVRPAAETNLSAAIYTAARSWSEYQNWRTGKLHPIASGTTPAKNEQMYEREMAELYQAAAERPYFILPRSPDLAVGGNYYLLQYWVTFLAHRSEVRLTRSEHPTNDIMLALRFANALTNDARTLTSRAHHEAITRAIQPVFDGIKLGKFSDADLKAIQDGFGQVDCYGLFRSWEHLVVRTAAMALTNPPTQFSPNLYGTLVPFFWGVYKPGSKVPGQLKTQQADLIADGLGDFAKVVDPKLGTIDLNHARAYRTRGDWPAELSNIVENHLRQGAFEFAMTRTSVELVGTACAIERFRLAENRLPQTLQELEPKYLDRVPLDVMTGAPLTYHLRTNGYRLYSFAGDRQDNGGVPEIMQQPRGGATHHDSRPFDWVWIYEK